MRAALATAAWVVSFVSSYSYTTKTLPDIENEDFIKDCVKMHNKFRSEVNPTASDMLYMPSQTGTTKSNTTTSRLGDAVTSVAITLRLFGQLVTKLAVQYNFALEFLALTVFPMEHILYATTDQQGTTPHGRIRQEPCAVPAPRMTSAWTISVLTNNETKSHVTTLLRIQTGPYIHVTDMLLFFSLLVQ
ncbi:glioma pathogenesis-related protein 1 isoform X2 [Nycticebus coucang]|uniref:glioma pathogenesis-related protein 1 isoform X2 n=1 Tax=Nycticebus coucang TaxID=9470 RepID=UPI00234C1365|nr:glioma pathogenesis-related protein 1 isoform X2 [Nycticebus coucang]